LSSFWGKTIPCSAVLPALCLWLAVCWLVLNKSHVWGCPTHFLCHSYLESFQAIFNTLILLSLNISSRPFKYGMERHPAEKWSRCQETTLYLVVSTTGRLSSTSTYFIWFMDLSVIVICWFHEPILPPKHYLSGRFDCFFKHAGRYSSPDLRLTVCTLSSATAMVNSSEKITWNKETNPCLRLLVYYEGNHRWFFLNSSQKIFSTNFLAKKIDHKCFQ